ncbi:MAG: sulfite exporter TauE/SafE family protein [Candidatus Omnitrophica bacterium]|nr:sulfite exporter TauE/SafE family protein [Candidatus Omnitrophota bacterium]
MFTGLILGMRHAFDRDHVAAVTHFISLEPDPVKSAWFGFRWALGHAVAVLLLGSMILILQLKLDPAFERYAGLAVGITLIVLGVWRLALLAQERRHTHRHAHRTKQHAHEHSHQPGREHVHRFAPTLVGIVHGASGTAELFVLIPITLISTTWMAYLYIGLFSLGCAATMSAYGYVAGRFYRRATQTGQRIYRALVIATSVSGLVLGAVWILKNL